MEWYLASRAPKVLGHEPTGVVVAIGEGVEKFNVGDRVFAHHHVACMSCRFCARGLFTMCPHYRSNNLDPGGMADFFRVPEANVRLGALRLPDEVSFEAGTTIEPMACAMRGINLSDIHQGDTVAVVGVGFMGMCYLQLLNLSPAGKIFVLDLSDWRLRTALSLGATHGINPTDEDPLEKLLDLNGGYLADSVFVTAPNLKAWELGLSLCEKGAILHLGAPPPPGTTWELDPTELYFREIRTNSSYSASHNETRAVLNLLSNKRLNGEALITHRFGLHQVEEAIRLHVAGDQSLKSIVVPSLTSEGLQPSPS